MVVSARDGELNDLKRYIEQQHVDVNAKNSRGKSALIAAAGSNQEHVVAYLLACDTLEVNITGKDGYTVMHEAAWWHRSAIIKMILDDGRIDLTIKNIWDKTAFDKAVDRRHEECIALLKVAFYN